ncbi:MAG: ATP-binding protein [Desulfobacteraceae bacterium]|nr:ATP-binding protein [Desulfobacteraceae bacterium]
MNPVTKQLQVASHPKHLKDIRNLLKKITAAGNLSQVASDSIILAVDEACSNIIRHSYNNDPGGKIELFFNLDAKRLSIRIVDYGTPCSPKILKPKVTEELQPGGLGIQIIHQVMDSVTYDFNDKDKNVLLMIKEFS